STPRPSGDQGSTPSPSAAQAGSTSRSMPRSSSEYSTCAQTSGARPGQAACQVAARAVSQPEKLEIPTYRARPELTAKSSAGSVVQRGVPAPGHGAERQPGHQESGAAERSLLHGK